MALTQALKEEFHCRNVALSYVNRQAFLRGQWDYHTPFLLYRVVVTAYTLFAYIYNYIAFSAYDSKGRMILVYLTVLTYNVLAIHLFLSAAIVILGYRKINFSNSYTIDSSSGGAESQIHTVSASRQSLHPRTSGDGNYNEDWHLPWYMKLNWLLFDIVIVASPIITFIYFFALPKAPNPTTMQLLVDYSMHASNTIIVVLEVCLTAIPVRIFHCIYPLMYMMAYVIFNTIYWALDEQQHVIYPNVLDWNHPASTCITIAITTVGMFILNIIYFLIYQARLKLSSSCGSNTLAGHYTVDVIALSGNR